MTTDTATPKQIALIERLISERNCAIADATIAALTKRAASTLIDSLLAMPKAVPTASDKAAAPKSTPNVTTAGFYMAEDAAGVTIFKVQRAVHGSGNLYAKVLDTATGSFEYVGRKPLYADGIRPLDIETAKSLGLLYGICVCCGATLTDEKSIAAGLGPICEKRLAAQAAA